MKKATYLITIQTDDGLREFSGSVDIVSTRLVIREDLPAGKLSNPSMVLMQVKRRITSPDFLSLDKEEIELLLGLMKGEMITPMLEHLEFLFKLHGNIFNKDKYLPIKKQVFEFVKQRAAKNMAMRNWIEKGKQTGDSETRSILEGRS